MSVPMNALAQSELCKGLSDAEVRTIHALAEEVRVAANALLFSEGDVGDAVYLVLGGNLDVLKRDAKGQDRVLASVSQGAVLGEMTLLHANASRSASVRATGDAALLKVPTQRFQGLLAQDAVAALKVVRNVARVLSQRLARVDQRVVDLLSRSEADKHEELHDFQKLLQNWSF